MVRNTSINVAHWRLFFLPEFPHLANLCLFWEKQGACSCLHNYSHQQMSKVSWTGSATCLSRWGMSSSNLSRLASSPFPSLQSTPPSVLLMKSAFPHISSFCFFPPSQDPQLQSPPLIVLCYHPPTSATPAHLICATSFFSWFFRDEK